LAILLISALATPGAILGVSGKRVRYVGGTLAHVPQNTEGFLELQEQAAVFAPKDPEMKAEIPYAAIHSLEYGLQSGRRVGWAVAAGPLFLLSKKRKHFLTVTFSDDTKRPQGAVFELAKGIVRQTLETLETKTGKQVEYESDEARKYAEKN
jgi:hypothetical protein